MADIPFALGVDFGTSTTAAVLRWPNGRPRSLLFDGSPLLPSAVFAEDHAILTGRDAQMAARSRPERLEAHPKRLIDDGSVLLGEREVPVADLIVAVLDRVWTEARRVASAPIASVALTHPAVWGPRRRQTLWDAATRLGMPAPALVPEPVAAAAYFTYELRRDVPVGSHVVVYDLGAGTFDASVVRRTAEGFEVLATTGLPDTGGLDIDAAVVGYLGATVLTSHPDLWRRLEQPTTVADRRAALLLWEDVKAAKEILSRISSATVHIPLLEDSVPVGREQLERLARPMLDRTVAATKGVINEARVTEQDIAGVFLVGGASRVPLISTLLHRALGFAPVAVEQPELVVAEGSAMMSAAVPPPTPLPAPQPVPVPQPVPPQLDWPPTQWPPPQWQVPSKPRGAGRRILLWSAPAVLLVAALVAVVVLRPWQKTAGGDGSTPSPTVSTSSSSASRPLIGTAVESAQKAAVPAGARKGGALTVAVEYQLDTLDPQLLFSEAERNVSGLVHRTLTGFREDGERPQLVGDLATDPGQDVSDGKCTAWEFTLRPGLTFEDGTPITAADVAYGVARSFQDLAGYADIQYWLSGDKGYTSTHKGPAKSLVLPPGVTLPATDRIRFTFAKPRCDFPLAASLPTTAPVPLAKDTAEYGKRPVASGPYKVIDFGPTDVKLVRNPAWTAASDPIRAALPDAVTVSVIEPNAFTNSVLAGQSRTEAAVALFGTPADAASRVPANRSVEGPAGLAFYLHINTARVTDPAVRKAINYAVNKQALVDLAGGPTRAKIMTTILPPTLPGHRAFDAYPAPPTGNPDEARRVLGGRPFPLVFAVHDTPERVARAEAIKASLDKAGFTVTLQRLPTDRFFQEVFKENAPYDLINTGFYPDWLGTGWYLSSIFGSAAIGQNGTSLSRFNAGDVVAEIDTATARPVDEAIGEWGRIDEKIMREYAPVVPLYVTYLHRTHGAKVKNVAISTVTGSLNLDRISVR